METKETLTRTVKNENRQKAMFWLVLLLPSHLKINANENAVTSRTTMASSNTLTLCIHPNIQHV